MKQNSTNIYIANCTFYRGLSFAMGSIGQYPGQINVIENVTAENIVLYDTIWGARIKTVSRAGAQTARSRHISANRGAVDRRQHGLPAQWRR